MDMSMCGGQGDQKGVDAHAAKHAWAWWPRARAAGVGQADRIDPCQATAFFIPYVDPRAQAMYHHFAHHTHTTQQPSTTTSKCTRTDNPWDHKEKTREREAQQAKKPISPGGPYPSTQSNAHPGSSSLFISCFWVYVHSAHHLPTHSIHRQGPPTVFLHAHPHKGKQGLAGAAGHLHCLEELGGGHHT